MKTMNKFVAGWAIVAAVMACSGLAAAGQAKIGEVKGEAFIANKEGLFRAKTGMVCVDGDMVMTRKGCYLDLIFNGKAGVRLLPETTSAIASADAEDVRILVAEGNVVFNVKPAAAGGQFTLDTPTAVAAVRGTQFWGRVTGSETDTLTTFAVKEGTVRVTSKETGKSVDLTVGQAADLANGVDGPQARSAQADEMAAMAVADQIRV